MSQHTYDIDPDGDIILTLHDPNSPFAVWEQDISLAVEPAIGMSLFKH